MEQEIIGAMLQINGLNPCLVPSKPERTAILILPAGIPEHHYRHIEGVKLWKTLGLARHLLIAGVSETPLNQEEVRDLCSPNLSCVHIANHARHTPDQMDWALDVVQELGVDHIIITTAAYHCPRAFLTMVRMMSKRNRRLILSTLPIIDLTDPRKDFMGFEQTGSTGPKGEIERIKRYRPTDVATTDEYLEYLEWRETAIAML